jgi:serine phosphatase RsbU (regulator of sigma subunit)
MRKGIIASLNPEGSEEESKDGMDCVLCAYDFENMKLEFAAANNPLWLIRNGELLEYKPDKMPVGMYHSKITPFSLHTIALEKGDIVYTFTDGYADQFGGEKGKKYKYKKLQEKLLAIKDLPLVDQKEILDSEFEKWKGNLEQVDDVLIIAVKI